jgi:ubiquinone/menaquinone biosynthesis C-methylase UbiE
MVKDKYYIIRKLEESSGYFSKSFSNRYMNWKRNHSLRNVFAREIGKLHSKNLIKVLDLGCGDGSLIFSLNIEFSKKYKLKFFGVDLSRLDIDFANRRSEYFDHKNCYFYAMDAQNLTFDNDEFDIVISSELAEHILEPHKVIKEVYRVLKKNGFFFLTTPNKGGGLFAQFLRLIKVRNNMKRIKATQRFLNKNTIVLTRLSSGGGDTGAGYGHVSVKSRREWVTILKKEGFKVFTQKGTGGLLFGSPYLDSYRILFAFSVILDTFLEKLPLSFLWSEIFFFELRK